MSGEPGFGGPISPRSSVVSPSELLMSFLNDTMSADVIPGGAVVGGATDKAQQEGCVSIMDAGNQKNELYAPLLWKRCQVRCMAGSLAEVDDIGNHVFDLLNDQQNLEIEDARGKLWFVHGIYCATGPSHHIDSPETWESLLFVNVTVGRDPIR